MSESLHLEPPPYERFQVPLLTPDLRSNSPLISIMLATAPKVPPPSTGMNLGSPCTPDHGPGQRTESTEQG